MIQLHAGNVSKRSWLHNGHKRTAYGYSLTAVEDDGTRRRYRKQFETRAEAQDALDALKDELKRPKAAVVPSITFDAAVTRYLAEKRKASLGEDKRILGHLKTHFGKDTPLAEITAGRISEYKAARLGAVRTIGEGETATERRLSGSTLNRALALLRHLLRLASDEWEVLESVPKIRLEDEPEGRLRWLTAEEARRLLAACQESRNADLADLVELSLFTGLRRGEALGLAWERVDRARGVILLDVTKNGRRREVPLNSRADAALARRGPKDAGLVFGTSDWDHFRSAWENAVTRAKLVDFHFHDLRHTFASWAVQRGVTLQEVKGLLGHRSMAMTLRYAHLSPEHLRGAVARLDSVLQDASRAEQKSAVRKVSQKSL